MEDMKIFVVACNADPTGLVVAKSEEEAVEIMKKQSMEDFGFIVAGIEAYEINSYFDDNTSYFFGWVKNKDQKYI